MPKSPRMLEHESGLSSRDFAAHALAVTQVYASQIRKAAEKVYQAGEFENKDMYIISGFRMLIDDYVCEALRYHCGGDYLDMVARAEALLEDICPEDLAAADELIHRAVTDFNSKPSDG